MHLAAARFARCAALAVCAIALSALGGDDRAFTEWARRSLEPITPDEQSFGALGRMVGDADVVALGEAVHFAAEPLEFRNHLFEYLVRHKGFTAIAVESGLVESRVAHDYVKTGSGGLPKALEQGLSWTFDRLPQNEVLLRWMRKYNADSSRSRKIAFYGFDVSGSPGNPNARRGMETSFVEALDYLKRVDPRRAAEFQSRLSTLITAITSGLSGPIASAYDGLSARERDEATAAVAELVAAFERREASYILRSSAEDYQWAYRAALAARDVDARMRLIPLGWKAPSDPRLLPSEATGFIFEMADLRDRVQAHNLDWIFEKEGLGAKVLVFGHRYHLSKAPVSRRFRAGTEERAQEVMGTYLARRLGARLVVIGNIVGGSQSGIGCDDFRIAPWIAAPESLDGLARIPGAKAYLLDLRRRPLDVLEVLDRQRTLSAGSSPIKLSPAQAFDVLLYIGDVTPACRGVS